MALASNDVWVVGAGFSWQTFNRVPYFLHWNGSAWQQGTLPSAPTGEFRSVTALSPTKVYAAGQKGTGQTLVAKWNGSTWSTEFTPSPGTSQNLVGASATSTGTVWAVGYRQNGAGWPGAPWPYAVRMARRLGQVAVRQPRLFLPTVSHGTATAGGLAVHTGRERPAAAAGTATWLECLHRMDSWRRTPPAPPIRVPTKPMSQSDQDPEAGVRPGAVLAAEPERPEQVALPGQPAGEAVRDQAPAERGPDHDQCAAAAPDVAVPPARVEQVGLGVVTPAQRDVGQHHPAPGRDRHAERDQEALELAR